MVLLIIIFFIAFVICIIYFGNKKEKGYYDGDRWYPIITNFNVPKQRIFTRKENMLSESDKEKK